MKIYNSQGTRYTEDGLKIYTLEELGVGKGILYFD